MLRPKSTVTDAGGRSWEVYVSRIALPAWREGASSGPDLEWWAFAGRWFYLVLPLVLLSWLWNSLLVPLLRVLAGLPGALAESRRSGTYSVEAITYWPREEHLRWETTADHVDRVVRQISDGLAGGEILRPLGATFLGSRTPSLH